MCPGEFKSRHLLCVIAHNDTDQVMKLIEIAGNLARSGLAEARNSVMALRPSSLRDKSLCAALDLMLKQMTYGVKLQAEFQSEGKEHPLPAEQEEGLFRMLTRQMAQQSPTVSYRNL